MFPYLCIIVTVVHLQYGVILLQYMFLFVLHCWSFLCIYPLFIGASVLLVVMGICLSLTPLKVLPSVLWLLSLLVFFSAFLSFALPLCCFSSFQSRISVIFLSTVTVTFLYFVIGWCTYDILRKSISSLSAKIDFLFVLVCGMFPLWGNNFTIFKPDIL